MAAVGHLATLFTGGLPEEFKVVAVKTWMTVDQVDAWVVGEIHRPPTSEHRPRQRRKTPLLKKLQRPRPPDISSNSHNAQINGTLRRSALQIDPSEELGMRLRKYTNRLHEYEGERIPEFAKHAEDLVMALRWAGRQRFEGHLLQEARFPLYCFVVVNCLPKIRSFQIKKLKDWATHEIDLLTTLEAAGKCTRICYSATMNVASDGKWRIEE
ncbi:hypothetical protein B0H14DRAFT_3884101, partial [Mycena olivaceomarginata]